MADLKSREKTRLRAASVRPHAEAVCAALLEGHAPLLEGHAPLSGNLRAEIAGSLRRGKVDVGDVEIVLEPRMDTDLFGEPVFTSAALDGAVARCIAEGLLAWDTKVVRDGPRHKRFVLPVLGIPLDLFIPALGSWGNILAIRTGDADFSRLMVTQRYKGGLLPNWMRHGDGRLFARAPGYPDFREEPEPNDYIESVLFCPTEEAFFAFLGLDVPPMYLRTQQGGEALAAVAVRSPPGVGGSE